MKLNLLLGSIALMVGTAAFAPAASERLSFTNEIAPIFVQKCLTCHAPEKNKGGYRLDTFDSMLKPGSSKEPSITPGQPERSKLFQLIITTDEDDRMPQKNEALSVDEIARIQRWIAEGASFDGPDAKAALVSIIPPIRQPDPPEIYPRPAPITALAFSPDGAELAASGYHEITIWNPLDGRLLRRIRNLAQCTLSLAYQPKGRLLAAASGTPGKNGEVKLFEASSGVLAKVLATSPDSMLTVAFNPDGSQLAAGGSDNAIRLFDTHTGKQERVIEQHADWVTSLCFSHSGKHLASASRDKSARLYDTATGEIEHSYLGHGDFVFGVAFSADDKQVVSSGRDRKVHVWSIGETNADKAKEISGFEGEVLQLIVTSNALFTCSSDQSARQHSMDKKHELIRTFGGHGDIVYALAWDENLQRLATGSFDGKVRIWNLRTTNVEPFLTFTAAPGLRRRE